MDPFHHRKVRYESALRPLGLWELFLRMPRKTQEHFWLKKVPDLIVEFDASIPKTDEYRELYTELDSEFRRAAIEVNGHLVSIRDVFSIFYGCLFVIQQTRSTAGFPNSIVEFMNKAEPVLKKVLDERLIDAMRQLHRAGDSLLYAKSRIDTRLLAVKADYPMIASGKVTLRLTVHKIEPQIRQLVVDGQPRRAYRVPAKWAMGDFRWLSWDVKQMQLPHQAGVPEEYPVFIQTHALDQMNKRINLTPAAPYLECWLSASLEKPNIVERHGRDLLVEYQIIGHRVGYLIVTLLDDAALVRTFKFLTMANTPEARLLEKQLRLTRRDVDWLGLHELSAFTQTDLKEDPELSALLKDCGCGHLFDLEPGEDFSPAPKPLAEEMRRYIRLAA